MQLSYVLQKIKQLKNKLLQIARQPNTQKKN